MPPVGEHMALPGSRTNPDLVAARFLLKPGRKYEQAVKAFEPYDSIKEENPEARTAGRALIAEGKAAGPKRRTFVFVNNRLEGNAISTIAAMIETG
jgi:glycerate-2-kinase